MGGPERVDRGGRTGGRSDGRTVFGRTGGPFSVGRADGRTGGPFSVGPFAVGPSSDGLPVLSSAQSMSCLSIK